MPATTPYEKEIRKKVHSKAILQGLTMRQVIYTALELWLKKFDDEHPKA